MRFALSNEQRSFANVLDDLLADADLPGTTRAWGHGDTARGFEVWNRLAEIGVTALGVPEEAGGLAAGPVDLAVAAETLGYHAVPGPWIESVAVAPTLLAGTEHAHLLAALADGTALITVAAEPHVPHALDAAAATHVFHAGDDGVAAAKSDGAVESVDPSRAMHTVQATAPPQPLRPGVLAGAFDRGALACSAALVGGGERMLTMAVEYATQRKQFGRVIGEYQALKHALADVKVALDFARPLVHGAARELAVATATASRDVSAAKVAAGEAARLAARVSLQVHGAIGYTMEHDLSIWLLRTRALVGAWGTASAHRARVLEHLAGS